MNTKIIGYFYHNMRQPKRINGCLELGYEGDFVEGEYDVVENQSGKHFGKTKISKKGNAHIRRILHMPSFTVVRYDQKPFADLFERVYERTNIKMKGYVAVQKKMLIYIYTLWKNNQPYQPQEYNISGNDESKSLFLLVSEGNSID